MAPTDLTGIDNYMVGLKKFAQAVVPGRARLMASVEEDHNALVMLTVQAAFGPAGESVTLPAARLYMLDENKKIRVERVISFTAPNR